MSSSASQVTLGIDTRLVMIISSSLFCAVLFWATWIHASKKLEFFHSKFTPGERADWCSRTASQFHSAFIVVAVGGTLPFYSWNEAFQTSHNLDLVHGSLCFSLGYFLYDLTLVLISRMDLWPLYVAHHCAASTPLIAVLFMGCEKYSFLIAAFFLVEVTTVSVNFSYWLEAFDMQYKKRYRFSVHFSFWAWIVFRIVMPVYLLYLMIDRLLLDGTQWVDASHVLKAKDTKEWGCAAVCSTCALMIIAYCNLVFFTSMVPSYAKRLRRRYQLIKTKIKDVRDKHREKKERQRQEKLVEKAR